MPLPKRRRKKRNMWAMEVYLMQKFADPRHFEQEDNSFEELTKIVNNERNKNDET